MSCKIAVCVPSAGTVQAFFAQSLANLVNECSRKDFNDLKDIRFELLLQVGSVIHLNREELVDRALACGADYILFMDDDMAVHHDAFRSLLLRRVPIAICNYPMRKFPIRFTSLGKDGKTPVKTTTESTGLEEVGFGGFGFALIHRSVFEAIPKPRFLPKYVAEGSTYTTEDYAFFEKVHAVGLPVFVDHDASKLIGHVGSILYRWDQTGEEINEK